MGKIKIVKEKMTDYTFVDNDLDLDSPSNEKGKASSDKSRAEPNLRLGDDAKINKIKHTSRITGGHNKQGHSSVYE
jgi:hypothetical protein